MAVNDTGSDTEEPICPEADPRDKPIDCPQTTWPEMSTANGHRNLAHTEVEKFAKCIKKIKSLTGGRYLHAQRHTSRELLIASQLRDRS